MYDIERKRTKAEERAYARLLDDLDLQERELRVMARDMDLVPRDWSTACNKVPVAPKKERTTIRLDADVLAWYRRLGRGHQNRMNVVLRAYMNAVISKAVEGGPGYRDALGKVI